MDRKSLTTMETNTPINGIVEGSEQKARDMATRYRCEFVDLRDYHLDAELFKTVPVDLMFRYNFVPLEQNDSTLAIAIADPSKLMMIDEIGLLLNRPLEAGLFLVIRLKSTTGDQIFELPAHVARSTKATSGDWVVGCELVTRLTPDEMEALL